MNEKYRYIIFTFIMSLLNGEYSLQKSLIDFARSKKAS